MQTVLLDLLAVVGKANQGVGPRPAAPSAQGSLTRRGSFRSDGDLYISCALGATISTQVLDQEHSGFRCLGCRGAAPHQHRYYVHVHGQHRTGAGGAFGYRLEVEFPMGRS